MLPLRGSNAAVERHIGVKKLAKQRRKQGRLHAAVEQISPRQKLKEPSQGRWILTNHIPSIPANLIMSQQHRRVSSSRASHAESIREQS